MLYKYKGIGECNSICDIELYGNIVVATELIENSGTSITNYAAQLANKIAKEFAIDKEQLKWIERYSNGEKINYTLVDFQLNKGLLSNPNWTPLSEENFHKAFKGYFQLSFKKYEEVDLEEVKELCNIYNAFLEPKSKRIYFKPTIINSNENYNGSINTIYHEMINIINKTR